MKLIDWNYTDNSTVEYFFDKNGQEVIKKVNRNDFSKYCEELSYNEDDNNLGSIDPKNLESEEYKFFNDYFDNQGNSNHDLSTIEIIEVDKVLEDCIKKGSVNLNKIDDVDFFCENVITGKL